MNNINNDSRNQVAYCLKVSDRKLEDPLSEGIRLSPTLVRLYHDSIDCIN